MIGEYGMTELSSQLYEGTLPRGRPRGPPGVFLEPATLRVFPVDPVTLEPVPDGEVGLAKIVDVCNVDSAVAISGPCRKTSLQLSLLSNLGLSDKTGHGAGSQSRSPVRNHKRAVPTRLSWQIVCAQQWVSGLARAKRSKEAIG